MDNAKPVVIVGASHAAAETVTQLRRQGWQGGITVIGDEIHLPYQRPPLSKAYFKGDVPVEKLLIRPEDVYVKAECEMLLGQRVKRLDLLDNFVVLDDDTQVEFGALVLCTGTRARLLPIAGADADNMMVLRTLDDVNNIRARVTPHSKLLVVGAGYIGLEIAASAVSLGVEVTVLEAQERVLARVTSPETSEYFTNLHAQAGVTIELGVGISEFVHSDDHAPSKVLLNDGREIEFDNAVIGIGVVPNTELAEAAGVLCDNGIVVDEFTATNIPGVYAIGDCCNHPSALYQRRIRLESVPNALEQARIVAQSICGNPEAYDSVPWFWSDQYDVKLQTVGLLEGYDTAVVRGEPKENKFAVFYLLKGRLLAVDAINSPIDFMVGKKLVANKVDLSAYDLSDPALNLKSLV